MIIYMVIVSILIVVLLVAVAWAGRSTGWPPEKEKMAILAALSSLILMIVATL